MNNKKHPDAQINVRTAESKSEVSCILLQTMSQISTGLTNTSNLCYSWFFLREAQIYFYLNTKIQFYSYQILGMRIDFFVYK